MVLPPETTDAGQISTEMGSDQIQDEQSHGGTPGESYCNPGHTCENSEQDYAIPG